jgi:hypothetical protein
MSMELVQQALDDIKARERAVIESRAQQLDQPWAEVGLGGQATRRLLQERAGRFIAACHKNRDDSQRGTASKMLHGSVDLRIESYHDHLELDFVTEVPNWQARLVKDELPIYPEIGQRTKSFGLQAIAAEEAILTTGWQAGFVEKRQVHNPVLSHTREQTGPGGYSVIPHYAEGHQEIEPAENKGRPVRLWRVVSGVTIDSKQIELREVTHDINPNNGELIIYASDLMDDDILGFSSSVFALGMLQNAIDFIER